MAVLSASAPAAVPALPSSPLAGAPILNPFHGLWIMSQEPYRGIVLANRLLFPRTFPSIPEGGVFPPCSKRGGRSRGNAAAAFRFSKSNPWCAPCIEEEREIVLVPPGLENHLGGWGCAASPSASGDCESRDHDIVWVGRGLKAHLIPPAAMVGGLVYPLGWDGEEGRKAGRQAGAVGSAIYNSHRPLREGRAPAANRSPRRSAIKGGLGPVSFSLGYGGESG